MTAAAGIRTTTRVQARGKHLWRADEPVRIHGVTYGSFKRRADGSGFPETASIRRDFTIMRRLGINTVRTYELPPPDLLDAAAGDGLQVLVGLDHHDWRTEEETDRRARRRIDAAAQRAVDEALERLAGRPEVLAVAVGNEVPVDLVRLHGRANIERTLTTMIERLHDGDPNLLATYVNYPTTEFLEVPNVDFVSFNLFLEQVDSFRRYIEHLQILSGAKPLVITEMGLAASVHGQKAQANLIRDQLQIIDETGTSGGVIFSFTDDWVVADKPVEGWGFGITNKSRRRKPVGRVIADWTTREYPRGLRDEWPALSVIVCAYNEEETIRDCLRSVLASPYPNLELILCDDGSSDSTADIATDLGVDVLKLDHGGLSRARNAGLERASGEIVAYLDADAACHPHWPFHLALSMESSVAATGGPNLPWPRAGTVERAIAHVPGQASEVLLGPGRAEHVPGCNMAFDRERLLDIGGFDIRYTSAGDDVDVCWKLLDEGHEIGFSTAAQVDHHRRKTIKGFLTQQRGYGRAERMLAGPHRARINSMGQARWRGFVYGPGRLLPRLFRSYVYTGAMGSAPFQPSLSDRSTQLGSWITTTLPLVATLAALAAGVGIWARPALFVTAACVVWLAVVGIAAGQSANLEHTERAPIKLRIVVGWLTVVAPLARTWGRLTGKPLDREDATSAWRGDRIDWLTRLVTHLRSAGAIVRTGGPNDFWDLEVSRQGPIAARVRTAVVWGWTPRSAVRYRPRKAWTAGLMGVLLFGALAGRTWLLVLAATTAGVVAFNVFRLRMTVNRSIEFTTRDTTDAAPTDWAKSIARTLVGRHLGAFMVIGAASVTTALLAAAAPLPLQVIIDNAIGGEPLGANVMSILDAIGLPTSGRGLAIVATIAFGTIAGLLAITGAIAGYLWLRLGNTLVEELSIEVYSSSLVADERFHRGMSTSDQLVRITTDTWSIYTVANLLVGVPATRVPTILAVGLAAYYLDASLTVWLFLMVPALTITARLAGRGLTDRARGEADALADLTGVVVDTARGLPEVLHLDASGRQLEFFGERGRRWRRHSLRSATMGVGAQTLNVTITQLLLALVLTIGGIEVIAGRSSIGTLVVFLGYTELLLREGRAIAGIHNQWSSARAGLDRVGEVLAADEVVDVDPEDAVLVPFGEDLEVCFDHISFAYDDTTVLDDISFCAQPNTITALVGPTGAGKTTLISLLPRLIDPNDGTITINGINHRHIPLDNLRQLIAVVRQDPHLFPATIGDNIAYGRPDATPSDITNAATAANIAEFIDTLPDGYDTIIGDGGITLSGGQRQRLAIARALLKDAPILILDEPTSALDAEIEAEIIDAIDNVVTGRTVFIIAHRLSTIRNADTIIVIDNGHIREHGTHQELLATNDLYHTLYTTQHQQPTPNDAPMRDAVAT